MMGLGNPHRPANFEVAIFRCNFMMALGNPRCIPNLKLLAPAVAEILKGAPKFWKAPLAQDHAYFSSGCNCTMGLGKPKLQTKFEVGSFSRCSNIKGQPQNFRELP